jgi:hypothetical protein
MEHATQSSFIQYSPAYLNSVLSITLIITKYISETVIVHQSIHITNGHIRLVKLAGRIYNLIHN